MSVVTQVLADAGRNFTLRITGSLREPLPLCRVCEIPMRGGRVSLDRANWAIQEKMGLALWWSKETSEPSNLILIMESRNAVTHSPQLQPPKHEDGTWAWSGSLWLESFGFERVPEPPVRFIITLDFDR